MLRWLVLLLLFTLPCVAADGPWGDHHGPATLQQRLHRLGQHDGSPVPADLVLMAGPAFAPGDTLPGLDLHLSTGLLLASGLTTSQFEEIMPWHPADAGTSDLRWQGDVALSGQLGEGFFFYQRTRLDSRPGLDPTSRTKEYRQIDASVEIPEAVVGYRSGPVNLWLGRRWEIWGPGWTGSLLLDAQSPPADGCGARWQRGRLSARWQVGRLDDAHTEAGYRARYLAAHRVDVRLHPRWRLGLAETALTSSARGLPLWMLNPLLPWSLSQQEDRAPDEQSNVMWAVDLTWNPDPHRAFYFQFLLDDVMVDLEDRGTYPDQMGILVGGVWAPRRQGSWQAGCEYARIWSWTYIHRRPELRYAAWDGPLGHPQGPDSEAVSVFVRRGPLPNRPGLLIWGRWHRHGAVRLDTDQSPVGGVDLPFPTLPVRHRLQFGSRLVLPTTGPLSAALSLGWSDAWTEDAQIPPPDGDAGPGGWWATLSARISWRASGLRL